jgi:hypothetical protein
MRITSVFNNRLICAAVLFLITGNCYSIALTRYGTEAVTNSSGTFAPSLRPGPSSTSKIWPNPENPFLIAEAEASGLTIQASSSGKVGPVVGAGGRAIGLDGNSNSFAFTVGIINIPFIIKQAGVGELTFKWEGTANYLTNAEGRSFAKISASGGGIGTVGQFLGPNPNVIDANGNFSLQREYLTNHTSAEDTLEFADQITLKWLFSDDDIGKLFTGAIRADTQLAFSNLDERFIGDQAGNNSLSFSLGHNDIFMAPVPIPAAIWLFGSALGLLDFRQHKTNETS